VLGTFDKREGLKFANLQMLENVIKSAIFSYDATDNEKEEKLTQKWDKEVIRRRRVILTIWHFTEQHKIVFTVCWGPEDGAFVGEGVRAKEVTLKEVS